MLESLPEIALEVTVLYAALFSHRLKPLGKVCWVFILHQQGFHVIGSSVSFSQQ